MTNIDELQELRARVEQLEGALQRALNRYDNEDKGTLETRPGLAWAMASDLRESLDGSGSE